VIDLFVRNARLTTVRNQTHLSSANLSDGPQTDGVFLAQKQALRLSDAFV